jgi:hypothetical protein
LEADAQGIDFRIIVGAPAQGGAEIDDVGVVVVRDIDAGACPAGSGVGGGGAVGEADDSVGERVRDGDGVGVDSVLPGEV